MYLCVHRQVCILIQSTVIHDSCVPYFSDISRSDCLDDPEKNVLQMWLIRTGL